MVIHYSTAFKALDDYVKAFNQGTDRVSYQLRQSVVSTAKELIRLYGVSLLKESSIDTDLTGDLPSLKTNNVQLAVLSNSSARTAQRHINRLLEAGIITKKIWHGSNASYELWINPHILLAKVKKGVNDLKSQAKNAIEKTALKFSNSTFNMDKSTNCPHTDSCNTTRDYNLIIGVEKTGDSFQRREQKLTEFSNSGDYTGDFTGDAGEKVAKKIEDAGGKERHITANIQNGEMNASRDQARAASLSLYANMLWDLSVKMLYRGRSLSAWQQENAKKLIFKLYEPVPTHNLGTIHNHYAARIAWQAACIERKPEERYVLLPHNYFDTSNPHGFVGTKAPFLKEEQRKKHLRNKLITDQQIRRYTANLKRPIHLQESLTTLFRQCEQRISKLKDTRLLRFFYASVLDKETMNQLYKD
ncbi:MAG: hypothetical protein JXQ90_18195 [Cyclobacteriaceae bacterium]